MKNTIEENLRSEIAFWRSLKDDWEKSSNQKVNSRIEDALALAEYKLRQFSSAYAKTRLH